MIKQSNYTVSENDILTFRRLRMAIGYLGFCLPLALVILSFIPFFKTNVQQSISHYYYTNLRELFTGLLCAVSLFLIRYKGYKNPVFWKNDNLMTNIAGAMALCVALVPTNPECCSDKIYTFIPICETWVGWVHYGFAFILFLVLATISFKVFTLGQKETNDIPISFLNENKIYRICGISIIVSIFMIPVSDYFEIPYSTLFFEALSLIAFGIAWLIKGRALGDRGKWGRMVYREHNL